MWRYQRLPQMLGPVSGFLQLFFLCFVLHCRIPLPVWQQTRSLIQVIKACSWTGGEIIFFFPSCYCRNVSCSCEAVADFGQQLVPSSRSEKTQIWAVEPSSTAWRFQLFCRGAFEPVTSCLVASLSTRVYCPVLVWCCLGSHQPWCFTGLEMAKS